jgi:hypothetical protein
MSFLLEKWVLKKVKWNIIKKQGGWKKRGKGRRMYNSLYYGTGGDIVIIE